MTARTDILFPPARIVSGHLYTPRTQDAEGRPLVYKSGANVGQPRNEFAFGIAIPKVAGQHWASTPWGAPIWAAGHAMMPQAGNMPTFAWKVQDGDSTALNTKGKANKDREGYAGNWIVYLSSANEPRIWNPHTKTYITEANAVMPGDWVEVSGNVAPNDSTQKPGVYINHSIVSFVGYDMANGRISIGPDAASIGFGQQQVAGVSLTPPPGMNTPAAPAPTPAPTASHAAPPPAPNVAPPNAPAAGGYAPPPAPVPVTPNPGMLVVPSAPPLTPAGPAAPPQASVAPPPPAPSATVATASPSSPVMTAKAGGATYESFIANGWTDVALREHQYIV